MEGNDDVTIVLNGISRAVTNRMTVREVLRDLGLEEVPVLVEWNGTALFPREFDSIQMAEGGVMEIIRIVAGG